MMIKNDCMTAYVAVRASLAEGQECVGVDLPFHRSLLLLHSSPSLGVLGSNKENK